MLTMTDNHFLQIREDDEEMKATMMRGIVKGSIDNDGERFLQVVRVPMRREMLDIVEAVANTIKKTVERMISRRLSSIRVVGPIVIDMIQSDKIRKSSFGKKNGSNYQYDVGVDLRIRSLTKTEKETIESILFALVEFSSQRGGIEVATSEPRASRVTELRVVKRQQGSSSTCFLVMFELTVTCDNQKRNVLVTLSDSPNNGFASHHPAFALNCGFEVKFSTDYPDGLFLAQTQALRSLSDAVFEIPQTPFMYTSVQLLKRFGLYDCCSTKLMFDMFSVEISADQFEQLLLVIVRAVQRGISVKGFQASTSARCYICQQHVDTDDDNDSDFIIFDEDEKLPLLTLNNVYFRDLEICSHCVCLKCLMSMKSSSANDSLRCGCCRRILSLCSKIEIKTQEEEGLLIYKLIPNACSVHEQQPITLLTNSAIFLPTMMQRRFPAIMDALFVQSAT
jgi:hypothetical protein